MKKRMIGWVLCIALSLSACSSQQQTAATTEAVTQTVAEETVNQNIGLYTSGTYQASAPGNNDSILVEVVFSEKEIVSVEILEHNETPGIYEPAFEKIPADIVGYQSLSVDTITGATRTSEGILEAVKDCVTQAGGDVAALLSVAIEKNGTNEEMTTEIVIVGGGAAGTAAGLEAAQAGAQVIVVEMTAAPAGQATMAGGLFAVDSTQQKETGQTGEAQWIYDEFITTSNYKANGGLLSRIIQKSGNTVDWLIENGCNLILAHAGTGGYYDHISQPISTLHGYVDGGTAGITALHQSIINNGGTVLYSTKAIELVMAGGKVTGIICEKEDGGLLTIHAQAVILASGGFGGNEEMVETVFGSGFGQSRVATNIGTGIEMAIAAEADASYEKAITMHYGLSRGGTAWGSALNSALLNPYLHVDVDGNRFMNEEAFIFEPIKSSNVLKALPQRTAYELFDSTMIEIVKEQGFAGITDLFVGDMADNPTIFVEVGHPVDTGARYEASHTPVDLTEEIETLVAEGVIIKAESPEEMAEKLGMNHLIETIERYNTLCEAGDDIDQFKSAQYLDNLEGTLYAIKITPSVFLGTLGGIEINQYCEVITPEGKAIPGLYSAGAETSGVYGDSYVYFEGGTLGYAYNSGRLAGESAALYIAD